MSARAYPVVCLTCLDEGEVLAQVCGQPAHTGACPCGRSVPVPCPDCRCTWCGESGADRVTEDGERLHAGCLPEWCRMVDGPVLWEPAEVVGRGRPARAEGSVRRA